MIRLATCAISAAFCLFVIGCGGGGSGSDSIRIGVLNSSTGDLATFGPAIESSLSIAQEDVNRRLAEEGSPFGISFEFEDTGTDPAQALQKLIALHEKGIKIVIGPMSSAEVEAVRDYSTANGIVLISPSSTSSTLSRSDDLVLRTVATDRGQAAAVATAIRYYGTNFYCPIWRGDDFGDGLTLMVGREVERRGGKFAPGARYATGTTDFIPSLHQLEIQLDAYFDFFGRNSAAVYAVAFDEIFSILKQADTRIFLKGVRWYGSDGIALNEGVFSDQSVVNFMRETKLLSPIFAGDRSSPDFARVRTAIETQLGTGPVRPYAIMAYDAAVLIGEAVTALGTLDFSGEALRDELINVSQSTSGASGSLALDSNGDRMPGTYEFWEIVRGDAGKDEWKLGALFEVNGQDYSRGRFIPQ